MTNEERDKLAEFNRRVGRWVEAQDMSASMKNTLRLIAYKASMDGWRHCTRVNKLVAASRSPMAKQLGITPVSLSTLRRHLTAFAEWGLVKRKHRTRPNGSSMSNEYMFRFDRVLVGGKLATFDFATGHIGEPVNEPEPMAAEPVPDCPAEPAAMADDWPEPYEDDYQDGYQDVEPEPSPFNLPRSAAVSGYRAKTSLAELL